MNDSTIASYRLPDGTVGHFLPHENSKTAELDDTGLTISGDGMESFYPNNRLLEVNSFSDPETYAWHSIKRDPVVQRVYEGDKTRLRDALLEMSSEFEDAAPRELKTWLRDSGIRDEAVIDALTRISFSSGLVEPDGEIQLSSSTDEVPA
ncbi:hypothetical protein GLU01_01630 [Nanohaloarchaea archaeon]|nr:hypothetical protein [Candidatus Nanohaloarchaea archaeon]